MNIKFFSTAHLILTVLFAAFFLYAGSQKFLKKPRPFDPIKHQKLSQQVTENNFSAPTTFHLTVKSMRSSGFLLFVGVLQIVGALLMFIPRTRLIGALILLPVVVNIFLLHVFMDNDRAEVVETGILLLANFIIIGFYLKSHLSKLIIRKKEQLA